jgi:type II secretory ATPase GspE/PulE/Tfp pilus assembly ATPase PilB-like protein
MAALNRLLDLGIEPFKLKEETLMRGLVSMRLFKKVCPHCREPLANHPERGAYRRVLDAYGELGLNQTYQRGVGCEHCKGSGTIGRIKAGEIIITNSEFLQRAISGDTDGAIRYWLEEMDGRTLKESAVSLMLQGIISVDELERWVGQLNQPGVY